MYFFLGCTSLKQTKPPLVGNNLIVEGEIIDGIVGGSLENKLDKEAKELSAITETRRNRDSINVKLRGDLLFAVGKASLSVEAQNILVQIAAILVKYPENLIKISGHSDSSGSIIANQALSKQRAQAVKDLFVQNKIPADRIEVFGVGAGSPIDTNETPAGRAKNRRIELEISMPKI